MSQFRTSHSFRTISWFTLIWLASSSPLNFSLPKEPQNVLGKELPIIQPVINVMPKNSNCVSCYSASPSTSTFKLVIATIKSSLPRFTDHFNFEKNDTSYTLRVPSRRSGLYSCGYPSIPTTFSRWSRATTRTTALIDNLPHLSTQEPPRTRCRSARNYPPPKSDRLCPRQARKTQSAVWAPKLFF